ncbi:MAG: FAD-dependent oxidoreductase [Oscillospiraceae bacterium]|nr:FAD-dependent oxidoreductase [Oscillospiraceae bacterium]
MIEKDIFIIGAGPAGSTAAIYAARAGLSTVVNENGLIGGQTANSVMIENYLGFMQISGRSFAERIEEQLKVSGALIQEFNNILELKLSDKEKIIETTSGCFSAKAVVIASGSSPRKLPVESEKRLSGRGIHYCSLCDGSLYKGKIVAVTGSGNAALEEALYLSEIASEVIMLCRSEVFHGERGLTRRVESCGNITLHFNENIVAAEGNRFLEYIETENAHSGKRFRYNVDALFVCIGSDPATEQFKDIINLDERGYIITDERLMTNVKGVFAAGDVRSKKWRQIITAAADGAIAALEAETFIKENLYA